MNRCLVSAVTFGALLGCSKTPSEDALPKNGGPTVRPQEISRVIKTPISQVGKCIDLTSEQVRAAGKFESGYTGPCKPEGSHEKGDIAVAETYVVNEARNFFAGKCSAIFYQPEAGAFDKAAPSPNFTGFTEITSGVVDAPPVVVKNWVFSQFKAGKMTNGYSVAAICLPLGLSSADIVKIEKESEAKISLDLGPVFDKKVVFSQ